MLGQRGHDRTYMSLGHRISRPNMDLEWVGPPLCVGARTFWNGYRATPCVARLFFLAKLKSVRIHGYDFFLLPGANTYLICIYIYIYIYMKISKKKSKQKYFMYISMFSISAKSFQEKQTLYVIYVKITNFGTPFDPYYLSQTRMYLSLKCV
jgi:hypothetical protein